MNFGIITTAPCVNVVPTPDTANCSDLAYAMSNWDKCQNSPRLIIKPARSLLCVLGSVQFRAFLVTGTIEEDVTSESTFTTSNQNVALVGASSGSCTATGQGDATISASYGEFTASASLSVIGNADDCCSEQNVAMMLLIDTSRSMSQACSGLYATRLDLAKAAAVRFANEVNQTKDSIGLMSFNMAGSSILSAPTDDNSAIAALVPTIAQTQQTTSFYSALASAIATLNATTSDLKVIVLFTDGEDTSGTYTDSNNPIALLAQFKDLGGVVMCFGTRASGAGFTRLEAFATGGFFVNGYPGAEQSAMNYLSGLKGYICAGNCTPAGDEIVAKGQLQYDNFINWDLDGGSVDLIGPGLFDFIPGNGLYVDLAGSSPPQYGRMISKDSFTLTTDHVYRISVALAGNQRSSKTPFSARVKVFWDNGGVETNLVDQTIVINDHTQTFHNYSFSFTAAGAYVVKISVEQEDVPTGLVDLEPYFGILLGSVKFEDTTDLVTILEDNFDTENLQYVPPACGTATYFHNGGYAVGTACNGYGCLDDTPPAQLPDPSPLPDIESGYNPPTVHTATETACASCPSGYINLPETALAESDDLEITLATAGQARQYLLVVTDPNSTALSPTPYRVLLEASNDGVTWATLDTRYKSLIVGGTSAPAVPLDVLFDNTSSYLRYRLTTTPSLPVGVDVEFSLYEAGPEQVCKSSTATSEISSHVAEEAAYAAAYILAEADLNCRKYWEETEQYTANCVPCHGTSVTKSASAYSLISQADAQLQAAAAAQAAAEAEIDCTGSNNDEFIDIIDGPNEPRAALPYPTTKYVSGLTGVISKVTATIRNYTHPSIGDVWILLMSPQGTALLLTQFGSGGVGSINMTNVPVVSVTFTLDDDGIVFTQGVPPVDGGSYKTHAFAPGSAGAQFPAPYPGTTPSNTITSPIANGDMAKFNGEDPNGCWSLWIIDLMVGGSGEIAAGWDLSITTV